MQISIVRILRYIRLFLVAIIVLSSIFCLYCTSHAFDLVSDNMPISDFVDWYCKNSKSNVLIGKNVDFIVSVNCKDVPDLEIESFFRSVVQANGCELVDKGGFLVVSPQEQKPLSFDSLSVHSTSSGSPSAVHVPIEIEGKAFQLLHVSNQEVITTVKEILSSFSDSRNLSGAGDAWLMGSNQFYVTGTTEQISLVTDLVSVLDVSSRTVLIEAIFVESTEGSGLDVGVSWSAGSPGGLGAVSVSDAVTSFLGGGGVSLLRGDLSMVVKALKSRSDVRVLSRPSILVSDGKSARVLVGQNIPVITGQSTGSSSTTDNPFQTIERKDVGVSLQVTPVVVGSDCVRLDLLLSASSVGSVEGLVDVATKQRDIQTHVSISPGQVVRLGGLVSRDVDISNGSVPFFGELPFVGALFRSRSESLVERNLDIFLTIQVI